MSEEVRVAAAFSAAEERCAAVRLAAPFLAALERLVDAARLVAAAFLAAADRFAEDAEPAPDEADLERVGAAFDRADDAPLPDLALLLDRDALDAERPPRFDWLLRRCSAISFAPPKSVWRSPVRTIAGRTRR